MMTFDEILSALQIDPENPQLHLDLAQSLLASKQNDQFSAQELELIRNGLTMAVQLKPDFYPGWLAMGDFYVRGNMPEQAVTAYRRATTLSPDDPVAQGKLAHQLCNIGDDAGARACFGRVIELVDHPPSHFRYMTSYDSFMESRMAIDSDREGLTQALAAIGQQEMIIDDPARDIVAVPLFALAYHHLCNRHINQLFDRTIRQIAPMIDHLSMKDAAFMPSGKIKIGFVSRYFYNHTIGRFFNGVITGLDPEIFDVHVFYTESRIDDYINRIGQSCHLHFLPRQTPIAAQMIRAVAPDILIYTDIGMDVFCTYLSMIRLAPVQACLYGHPDTSGNRNIDYYLSSGLCEPDGADAHYTEKMVRLGNEATYCCYERKKFDKGGVSRADYGFTDRQKLYLCAQSLFKLHPDMDDLFCQILERDQSAQILLFADISQYRTGRFQARIARTIGDVARIHILPRQTLDCFLWIVDFSDVVLDSLHFSGGDTSFNTFNVGAPLVTLPGAFLRGRQTYGLYRRMGMMDLVASDGEDYVAKAIELAKNQDFNHAMRQKIMAHSPVIFNDQGFTRDLEQFVQSLCG